MNDVYAAPQSELNTEQSPELTFKSLGFWRKLFLFINWAVTFILVALLAIGGSFGDSETEISGALLVVISILAIAYSYWVHTAVCKRAVSQLMALGIIQIIPFFNPIAAIIFFAIRSTSKKEVGPEQ